MNYREIAFQRFKEGEEPYCEECGILESEACEKYKNGLDVHHLDCLPKSDPNYHMNNEPENLKVLCMECHLSIHKSGESHHMYGVSHSDETRKKMSRSQITRFRLNPHPSLGTKLSDSHKRKISNSLVGNTRRLGKLHSEKDRAKISAGLLKAYENPELRKKLSDSRKGEMNGMYGKSHSEETRSKISEARKGKGTSPRSDEAKHNISEALKKANYLHTNYELNVYCNKSTKPDGFRMVKNLRISKEDKDRINSLPTYSLEDYCKLIE